MKKLLFAAVALILLAPVSKADEGMWLLPLLEKMNAEAMRNLGSRLTPEQIYSVNNSSIKDAVVQFGGGCTGEIISGKGLLVTNHHCGYSSIQSLSSPEHNYLEDGFFAKSGKEEIPVPGLSVKFLQSMTDVTPEAATQEGRDAIIRKAKEENPGCKAEVVSFFNGNAWYLVISKIYRDVRFVGAPPAASGKFGGDTDNWMWPRHTCDFSMFRVYAGPDNEPADYSEDNKPFTPKQFLNISLKGAEEGDFAMVMGYSGSTQRFQTAAQLQDMLETNDIRIDARTVRQEVIWNARMADEKVNLQYASKYASSSNGWKKWQGMRDAFAKLGILENEIIKEEAFTQWIQANPSRKALYGDAIPAIAAAVAKAAPSKKAYQLLNESLGTIEILSIANNFYSSLRSLDNSNITPDSPNFKEMEKQVIDIAKKTALEKYKDYDSNVDHDVTVAVLDFYKERVNAADAIQFKGILKTDSRKFADELFGKSIFASEEKLNSKALTRKMIESDPAVLLVKAVAEKASELREGVQTGSAEVKEPSKTFAAGLMEWRQGESFYPDANSTCRLSYGSVKGYEPKDGVHYKHYTTLKGVMEKEDPGNYEFRVPARLKEIYEAKDYGQYANADGELVTCFLTNLDITGGNSGSPVMDADGNLIGLAFDGNWEAMSSDVLFNPDLQRCICVDIRYVLLMMDKFAGAGYLLDEMNLVN